MFFPCFFEVQLEGFIFFNTQNISKNPQPTLRWSAVGAAPWCWDHPGLDFLRPLEKLENMENHMGCSYSVFSQ